MALTLEGKLDRIKRKNRFLSWLLPLWFSHVHTDTPSIFRSVFNILFELNFGAKSPSYTSFSLVTSTWRMNAYMCSSFFTTSFQTHKYITFEARLIVLDAISRYFGTISNNGAEKLANSNQCQENITCSQR